MADSEVRQKFEAAEIENRIGFIRNEVVQACPSIRPNDREWILALLVTEVEQAYAAGMRAGEIARWIPVEEKLPERAGIVICYGIRANGQSTIQMTTFFAGAFDMEDQSYQQPPSATHWQPLPAAPEEKKS